MKHKYNEKFKVYSNLNRYLFSNIPSRKKVLDVGCGIGILGEKLKKEKNCVVYGVDISSKAIKLAKKKLDKVEEMNIVSDELPFKEKFDVIVFGDVLEHVAWPEEILKKFKRYLKDEGIIIASIPNVANIITRLQLLVGNWNYKDSGILDNTHLRFFTKETALQMFRKVDMEIEKINGTSLFRKKFNFISKIMKKMSPNLFSLQFIIVSKIKKSKL